MGDSVSIFVLKSSKAIEAIKAINNNDAHFALVVDNKQKLIGTVTDGDIRRGLLKGNSLESNVGEFMNSKFRYISEDEVNKININEVFDNGIKQIPLLDKLGRVKKILKKEEISHRKSLINTAVIMAGGKGTRLRPHTSNCPKPMLLIQGRPMLEIILRKCINSGFSNFFFSVNYLKDQIIDYFDDGSKWGVKINYLLEDSPLGTAGSLKLIPKSFKDPFLVLNGDIITELDLNALVNFHKKCSASITVAAKNEVNTIPYGVIYTSGLDLVKIVEKPVQNFLVSAGVYVINPEIIEFIKENEYFDMPNLINTAKENCFKVVTFPIYEYWQDVGIPETLKKVSKNLDLKDKDLFNQI